MNPHRLPAGRVLIIRPLAVRTGLWCHHCNLPSGLQLRVGIIDAHTGTMLADNLIRRCHDCGAEIEEETQ